MNIAFEEARLRRIARRLDIRMMKSRSRRLQDPSCGGYMLADLYRNFAIAGSTPFPYSLSLEDVRDYLEDAMKEDRTEAAGHSELVTETDPTLAVVI